LELRRRGPAQDRQQIEAQGKRAQATNKAKWASGVPPETRQPTNSLAAKASHWNKAAGIPSINRVDKAETGDIAQSRPKPILSDVPFLAPLHRRHRGKT
jgi:hypothetical protein